MRSRNKRVVNALRATLAQSGTWQSPRNAQDIYTIVPADLAAADEEVQFREQEWRQAGAVQVAEPQVDHARRRAKELQIEFRQARARGRRSFRLKYLNLVRLFVLTGLPPLGKATVIGSSAAIISALSF